MSLMNLSEIMDKSLDILRKHIKSIVLFTIGYGIIIFISVFILIIIGVIAATLSISVFHSPAVAVISICVIVVIAAAIIVSMYSGIIKIAAQEYVEGPVFTHDAMKAAFKNILNVFVIIFCGVVAFIPAGAFIGWLTYILIKRIDTTIGLINSASGRAVILIVLGVLLILFAIFIFMIYFTWFSFSIHALVIEAKGPFSAIKRGFGLVRRNYWKVFGSVILFTLIVYLIEASIESFFVLASSALYYIFKLLNISQDYISFMSSVYGFLSWPISLVYSMVITPIGAIMLTMLYFNQRFHKEGFDILLRLRAIEKNNERKQTSEGFEFNNSL